MTQEFFRLGNLLIIEGKFCFDTIDQVLYLESIMKNSGAENDIALRITVGMRGLGNTSPFSKNYISIRTNCSTSFCIDMISFIEFFLFLSSIIW